MHKTDVIRRVARETRLSQRVVSDVISTTHRLIEATLREGKSVTFPGFGTFQPSHRQGGKLKNIRTGDVMEYPARMIATFRAGEVLRRAVRGEHRQGRAVTRNHRRKKS